MLASSRFRNIRLAHIDNNRLRYGNRRGLCVGVCGTVVDPPGLLAEPGGDGVRCDHCHLLLWCSPLCAQLHGRSTLLDNWGSPQILCPSSKELHEEICLCVIDRHPFERASANHHKAYLFPREEDSIQLIWVKYDQKTATLTIEDGSFHTFGVRARCDPTRHLLLRDDPKMQAWDFEYDLLLISYPQVSTSIRHYQVNHSIADLAKPLQLKTWCGPVVMVAVSPSPSGGYCFVHDVNYRDISAAVMHYLGREDNPCWPLAPSWSETVYPALRLTDTTNNFIASAFGRQPPMAPVPVAHHKDLIWKPCIAAHRLGLRWYISTGNSPSWKNLDQGNHHNARWLKYVPDDDWEWKDWCRAAPCRDHVAVPKLNVFPVDGSILLIHGDRIPIQPEHVLLFNEYLDHVFKKVAIPFRDEFAGVCATRSVKRPDSLPPIDSTPESRAGGGTFNDMTYWIELGSTTGALEPRLQDILPWYKLRHAVMAERNDPGAHIDGIHDLVASLLIAAIVVECDRPNYGPFFIGRRIFHCSSDPTVPSDNDLAAASAGKFYKIALWTNRGLLCIRHGPRGFYFDLIATAPSEAEDYPPRRSTSSARRRRHSLCSSDHLGAKFRDKIIQERKLAGWQRTDAQVDGLGQWQGPVRSDNDLNY